MTEFKYLPSTKDIHMSDDTPIQEACLLEIAYQLKKIADLMRNSK